MALRDLAAIQWLPGSETAVESRSSRIGPIRLGAERVLRETRMLRSRWRGLETWHGRDGVTLANERARQQGLPALQHACKHAMDEPVSPHGSAGGMIPSTRLTAAAW